MEKQFVFFLNYIKCICRGDPNILHLKIGLPGFNVHASNLYDIADVTSRRVQFSKFSL